MTTASGIGLRSAHYRDFLGGNFFVDESIVRADDKVALGFVEVHSENFFGRGNAPLRGAPRQLLERVRSEFALSLHGIGLSLGAAEPPQNTHLQQLKWLVDDFDPLFVSDHLAWVGIDGIYANDLLPLPYTEESLRVVVDNIDAVQNYLGRTLLLENPSRYLDFLHSTIDESEFLNAVTRRTGCGILLDVNNVFVSASNLGFDAQAYISAIDPAAVQEIHLAGFSEIGSESGSESGNCLIDTHNHPVDERVWRLYAYALECFGDKPTLIEWDTDLPALDILLDEKNKADALRSARGLTVEANHAIPA